MIVLKLSDMKRKIVICVIVVQIIVVLLVGKNVLVKKGMEVLGQASVNIINESDVVASSSVGLKYFYEPGPGIVTRDLGWMGDKFKYSVRYAINADTLNQLEDYPPEKSANTYRIITLGDSFTFGLNVNTEKNYPSQLQEMLNHECKDNMKYEVINLGVSGYDIQYAVNRFQLRGIKYNPDLVIWNIAGDDLLRINEKLLPQYKKEEVGKTLKEHFANWKNSREQVIKDLGGEREVFDMQLNHFKKIDKYFHNTLVITTISNAPAEYIETLTRMAKARQNTFLYTNIRNIYKLDAALPDYHPNEKGYRIIAEDSFQYLKDNNIIPCR